ncbi:hypothetical protein LOC67_15010 [Stieleria sp. JC731]|uniref:hypothetical protein n=1 Tax=Pirellulaceae TaxID=2691357 RepID=UPI001E5E632D|nr:hypothetical protein [Stieleria sp. JC731]MCC9601869.1 hypothetical protein [Stieleria sp. JC731]
MDDRDLDRMPNPFSPFAEEGKRSRETFVSTAKWLLIAILMFVGLTFAQKHSQKLRVADLLSQFDLTDDPNAGDSLSKIDTVKDDTDKTKLLVKALCSENEATCKEAARRLFELNSQWTTIQTDEQLRLRCNLARELTASMMGRESDTRHHQDHAQQVARAVFEQLVETPPGIDAEQNQSRMMAIDAIAMLLQNNNADTASVATADKTESSSDSMATPPTMLSQTDTNWTDWPPTSPTIYRKQVTSLNKVNQPAVVLNQVSDEPNDRRTAAVLVRPSIGASSPQQDTPEETASDQREQEYQNARIDYWAKMLSRQSRLDRMEAVTTLSKIAHPRVARILSSHIVNERDPHVAKLIRNYFEKQTR